MSLKDKLEIGLKPDAPYRPDNLPDIQRNDPDCQEAGKPGESSKLKQAREACDVKPQPRKAAAPARRTRRSAAPARKPVARRRTR